MAENLNSPLPHETPGGAAARGAAPAPERRVWTTDQLLGQDREVLIQHGDDVYRLRVTRHGKLILYK